MPSYDKKCLDTTATTTDEIVQAVINKLCAVDTSLSSITSQINNTLVDTVQSLIGNYLNANITATGGLKKTGSGANVALQFYGSVPPFCPIPCRAPLSNFNANGTGKVGTAFENWVICNGVSQTDDARGYVYAGATNLAGIEGPTLDARVTDYLSNPGQKVGENKHQLTVNELPIHSHAAGDSSASVQTFTMYNFSVRSGTDAQTMSKYPFNGATGQDSITTTGSVTQQDTGNAGLNIPHETRQPTIYCYYIMRLS